MSSTAQIEAAGPKVSGATTDNDDSLLLKGQKIDERDRKEILETIDRVASGNRLAAGPALFRLNPTKNGFLFPLFVNVAAALAVIGGFAGSSIYFSKQQSTISSQAGTFFSAEGKLIEQVRKEAEARIQQKDSEIASIKGKLTQLDQESAALRSNMQATIQAKEAALKAQMDAELAAEKARLGKLGISQSEIDTRLAAYEQQKNAQLDQAIAAYRSQSEAALAEKEKEIQAQAEQSRKALALADQERQQLQDQATKQEAALRAQYEAQTQRLQSANLQLQAESSAAQAKLQALAAQTQNEQLLTDQIVGSYSAILGDIRTAQYTKAQNDITALKALLNGVDAAALPDIAKRRPVDLQLIASLEDLIKARTQPGQPVVDPAVVQRSDQVVSAQGFVAQAQAEEKKGNAAAANDFYTRALGVIPAVEQAYTAMRSFLEKSSNAELARRDAAAAALKAQSDQKSAEIARLTASLNEARAALAANETSLRAAQASLADSRTAAGGLQSRVGDQNAKITALEKELAAAKSTIDELNSKLAEATTAVANLQKEVDAQKGGAGQSAKQIESVQSENADLKKQLAASQAKVGELGAQIEASNRKIAQLGSVITSANAKIAQLETMSARYAATISTLQGDYADYKGQLLALINGGTPADIERAQSLLLKFVGGPSFETLLPGFSSVASGVGKGAVSLAESSGHDAALNNVLLVTGYLSGNDGVGPRAAGVKQSIDAKVAGDPLFRAAAASIQRLAEQQGTASGRSAVATQYRLIGTVSFISANSVTVEKLVSMQLAPGDLVLIRHKGASGPEVPVAQGEVSAVSSDSVTVRVTSLLQGSDSPELLDAVYLETSGT